MSAVRKASEAALKKGFTDTDSDDETHHAQEAISNTAKAIAAAHLQPIPEQESCRAPENYQDELTTVIVFGADGNLSRRKTFPALFRLYFQGHLAEDAIIVGYARAPMDEDDFRDMVYKSVYSPTVHSEPRKNFLAQVTYESGQFNVVDHFRALREAVEHREALQLLEWQQRTHTGGMGAFEPHRVRLYYLAVPSFIYYDICRCMKEAGMATDSKVDRFVLEKPFGRDSGTCAKLLHDLSLVLTEDVSYRIDHYLGKELIMNLLVLRFANICFEAIWNRHHVASVQVIFKEKVGLDGRGGYFDQYGVIRDVMQNHLTQILALVAMEQPLSLCAAHILQEKIKVLSSVRPLAREDLVVGQYAGYLDEDTIENKQSTTETFAAAVLHINNPRWAGVPFVLKAGKALNENRAEVRVRFNKVPGCVPELEKFPENELIIRVQPNEGIYWKVQNKVPGLEFQVRTMRMDLTYQAKYSRTELPEAYERLILNVLRGDKSHFVHADELKLSWHIFTPVLHQLEKAKERPHSYIRNTRGPPAADDLAQRYGMRKFGSLRFESEEMQPPTSSRREGRSERQRSDHTRAGVGAHSLPAPPVGDHRNGGSVPSTARSEWPGNEPNQTSVPVPATPQVPVRSSSAASNGSPVGVQRAALANPFTSGSVPEPSVR